MKKQMKINFKALYLLLSLALIITAMFALTLNVGASNDAADEIPYVGIPEGDTSEFAILEYNSETNSYEYKASYTTWAKATAGVKDYSENASDKLVLLLRKDYKNENSAGDTGAFGLVRGELIIDLGGYTLTKSNGKALIYLESTADNSSIESNIVVKNGTILTNGYGVLEAKTATDIEKTWNITVEDVTLGLMKGKTPSSSSGFVWMMWGNGSSNAIYNVDFNNCTFDLRTNITGAVPYMFNTVKGTYCIDFDINGGKIICDNLADVTLLTQHKTNNDDTVTFGKNSNGEYTKLVSASTAAAYTNALACDDTDRYFVKTSDNGTDTTYKLLPYGEGLIYENYPIDENPIADNRLAIFAFNSETGKYECKGLYNTWASATKATKNYTSLDSDKAVLFVRTDFENGTTDSGTCSTDAFGLVNGELIIDLGGNTLTKTSGKYLIGVTTTNDMEGIEGKLIVRNGTLLTKTSGIFEGKGPSTVNKTWDITVEDVTLGMNGMGTPSGNGVLWTMWGNSSTAGENLKYNVKFNNCTFDLRTNVSSTVNYPININGVYHIDFKINGGEIICDNLVRFYTKKDTDDSTVTFGANSDGEYIKHIASNTASAYTKDVDADDGKRRFVKASDNGTDTTYVLLPTDLLSFNPKTSITLGSELVYNVYVPAGDSLKSFTVDGIAYENAKLVTLADGSSYYHVAVSLPAAEAARDVVLKATVIANGKDFDGTWTMSVPKYAKKVIDSKTSTDVEKTLVKDVLAYIKAAYVYFNGIDKTLVSDAALEAANEKIGAILGDYSNTFAKADGSTNTPGLTAATLVLTENPIVRFYLAEGKTKEDYTFKYGNTVLGYAAEGTAELNGVTYNYVDISLYAYQLTGEITYTDGTNSGTYHINSYYDFVTTDNEYKDNENLITLVEKLYNYAKSAEAYRTFVIGN